MIVDNEDLNTQGEDEVEAATEGAGEAGAKGAAEAKGTQQGKEPAASAEGKPAGKDTAAPASDDKDKAPAKPGKATIAGGADGEAEAATKEAAAKPYWPEDWRQKAAEHLAAGDKKAYDRELKRLQRIADPSAIYGMYRELDNRLNGGGLLKVPTKDAKPEEVAAFHKALGVPEKAEDYLKDVKLENGAVLGAADRPAAEQFVQAVHKAGAPPAVVNAALNWYFTRLQEQAEALDESDDKFHIDSERALKEEWGGAFKRNAASVKTLFADAPGGTDLKNPNSLYARLMGGRTSDGKLIGDDPDMWRFLHGKATEINPAVTVTEDGDQSGKSIDAEISKIEEIMKSDRPRYNREFAGRYTELLEARIKIKARQGA